jgi:hypothetical protein
MNKFFIVGCPRSGTTMLQQALNRHSAIVIPPETKFFFSFLGRSRESQLKHLKRINADLQIGMPAPQQRIRSGPGARAFYDQMARLYLQKLGRNGDVHFGEKTPEHTGRLRLVRRLFPDAKVIFIYRDGRDVALSMTKVPWMDPDLYVNFAVWLYYYRILTQARSGEPPGLLCVRYEDLVTNPPEELRIILAFL